jgi:hypothetical protein
MWVKSQKTNPYRYTLYTDTTPNSLLPDICLMWRRDFVIITKITGDNKQMH